MQGSQRKWIPSVEQRTITGKGGQRSQGSWERLEAWPLFPAMFETCSKRQQLSLRHFLAWKYTVSPTTAVSPLRLPHEFSCFSNKMHYWIEIASAKAQEALANKAVAPKYLLWMCWILHWLIDCFAVCELWTVILDVFSNLNDSVILCVRGRRRRWVGKMERESKIMK